MDYSHILDPKPTVRSLQYNNTMVFDKKLARTSVDLKGCYPTPNSHGNPCHRCFLKTRVFIGPLLGFRMGSSFDA